MCAKLCVVSVYRRACLVSVYVCVVHEQCVYTRICVFGMCLACVCISGMCMCGPCLAHMCIFGVYASHIGYMHGFGICMCAYVCSSTEKVLPAVRRGPHLGRMEVERTAQGGGVWGRKLRSLF